MRIILAAPAAAVCLLLAACERPQQATLPLEEGARVEWHGLLPCIDCDGIEVRLVLGREGNNRGYRLVETYLTGSGGARFEDAGWWEAGDGLLQLQGADGSMRTWAVLADGRLQVRGPEGQPLPGASDHLLVPARGTGLVPVPENNP